MSKNHGTDEVRREYFEELVCKWYSAFLVPKGFQRSFKLGRVGPNKFILAIDVKDEPERPWVHDAFADWWATCELSKRVSLYWMPFTEETYSRIARQEFFASCTGNDLGDTVVVGCETEFSVRRVDDREVDDLLTIR